MLFLRYTVTVSVLPRQADAARANLALVLAIGLLDLVAVTVCSLVLVESRTAPRLLMMLSFLFLLVGDVLLGLDYWTETSISQRLFLLAVARLGAVLRARRPSTPGRPPYGRGPCARWCGRWSSTRRCWSPTSSASASWCGATA